jgi:hypothetical protein
MAQSTVIFLFLAVLGGLCVAGTVFIVQRLTPQHRRAAVLRWLLRWSGKGLAAPLVLWMIMNLGLSWRLQPFMPQVQMAQNAGVSWFPPFLVVTGYGFFVLASFWMAMTLGWTLIQLGQSLEGDQRAQLKSLSWTCAIGLIIPAGLIQIVGGSPMLGIAAGTILVPLALYAQMVLNARKLPPMYARAIARIKFGKYAEAEMEIISELEKCEDDFDGWIMLAELYANQFRDLSEAEQTVMDICNHPRTNSSQLSVALHKLADWHLKLMGDPEAACRALQMICTRLPGTHLARMAELRIHQLPRTALDMRAQAGRPIPLKSTQDPLDQALHPNDANPDVDEALRQANACVENLNRNPNNVVEREKLARLLAERMKQADRGIEQLMLLVRQPGQPEAKRAAWLALAASWHLNLRKDPDSGRKLLERVVRDYPESAQAFPARRRLLALQAAKAGQSGT